MDAATFAAVRELDRQLIPVLAVPALDRISARQFLSYLGEYRALVAGLQPELAPELTRQEGALAALTPARQSRLVAALVADDAGAIFDLAADLGIHAEVLYVLGQLTLRPYLIAYARRLVDRGLVSLAGMHGGRCPVCGRAAHMGHISAENIKYLHCPACDTVWRTARVGCAFCGCTDPARVGFFTLEDDPEHRVEHCKECGGYVKVLDQRVRGRTVDFLVEDAATAHLDQLAMSEGFHK